MKKTDFLISKARIFNFKNSKAPRHKLIYLFLLFCFFNNSNANQENNISNNQVITNLHSKLISLNFENLSIKAAFKILAEFTGLNIIVSEKVTGNITLHVASLPCDQVLEILLASQSLGSRNIGNTLFIAPLSEIINFKKQFAKSQKADSHLEKLHAEFIQIKYAKANELEIFLKDQKSSPLSNRGALIVDSRTNRIWIKDTAEQLTTTKAFIRQLDTPVKQVMIEARIVNVTKNFSYDIGVQFNKAKLTLTNIDNPKSSSTKESNKLSGMSFDVSPVGLAGGIWGLGKLKAGILLDLELSALESSGQGEVIARPRLIVTNQQTAIIESGEEVAYTESRGDSGTATAFKKAVLGLKVTPQILPNNKILIDLKINQDLLSPKIYNGTPVILTKEMQTNVLVNNGQTIVLGGIYKQDKQNRVSEVPILAKLPLLGILFKNKSSVIKKEELLIFITPRIIPNSLKLEDL